jgi:zinc protease
VRAPAAAALVALLLAPAAGAQAPWPSEPPPAPLPARQVNIPPYELRTLASGMRVVSVAHHEQPAVTIRLLVGAGAAQDPEGKAGVAGMVAQLLNQGTTSRSASEIADFIDSIGGALGIGSGTDLTSVYTVVMKDSFDVAMDLVADVVRNPAFSPEEIERQREQAASQLQVNFEDPAYVASVLFDRLVYGFHPYGRGRTPDTLASITRDDLRAFHGRHYAPNNVILAIVGDIVAEEAFAEAERVFGAWPRADVPAWTVQDPPAPTHRLIVVDKPDAVQTEIRVGQIAIPRRHDDFLAFDLAVKILGGEGANRLHRVLRSERGLTYGAEADTRALQHAGDFVAQTNTRTETTVEVLQLALEEFRRIQQQPVFRGELGDAQAYLAGSFPLTIETPNDIATTVINAVHYDLPLDEVETYRERVSAITPADIQRVAGRYIRPDRLSIVLVGNASAFTSDLRAAGFTDLEVIPIALLDLSAASLRGGVRSP